jgi:hypothetical protein
MHDSNDKKPGQSPPLPPGAQPQAAGRSLEGAPPCNTAPANCNPGGTVKIVRQGIDSLYLSYPGKISLEIDLKLKTLKELAQSEIPLDQALAFYEIGAHQYEVMGKGSQYYPYVLRDKAHYLKVSSFKSKQMPLAYIQIDSQWLAGKGINPAVTELDDIVAELGQVEDVAQISRADLYVDFVADCDIEAFQPGQFVSRAKRISTHTMERVFTGYSIGLGGDISARLYDKTREIADVSHKDYLFPLWQAQGWEQGETVYRLEFQLERTTLKSHDIMTVPELMRSLGQLWRYATLNWLKLTIPSQTDTTKSRWPLHSLWAALADVDWPDTLEGVSVPLRSQNTPSDRYICENGLGGLTSLMAREGITDPLVAFDSFYDLVKAYHNDRRHFTGIDFSEYLREKAALKAKRYNRLYPGMKASRDRKLAEVTAKAYRKLKDGE